MASSGQLQIRAHRFANDQRTRDLFSLCQVNAVELRLRSGGRISPVSTRCYVQPSFQRCHINAFGASV